MVHSIYFPGITRIAKARFFPRSIKKIKSLRKTDTHALSVCDLQMLFLLMIAGVYFSARLLIYLYVPLPLDLSAATQVLIEIHRGSVAPEAVERYVFLVLSVFFPLISLFSIVLLSEVMPSKRETVAIGAPFLVAFAILAPFFQSDFVSVLFGSYPRVDLVVHGPLLTALCLSIIFCLFHIHSSYRQFSGSRFVVGLVAGGAIILQLASWRLVSVASVTAGPNWSSHADPIFYVLNAVASGKTLLSDLPSQYGLFAEILAPMLRVTGVSVFSVSGMFALLQFISLGSLVFVLRRLVKSNVVFAVSAVSVVLVTFETVMYFGGHPERYFQYWPIRFFWPGVSVISFYLFSQRQSMIRGAWNAVVGTVAVLWNFDSGLFVIVAFGSYLGARAFFGKQGGASLASSWIRADYLRMMVLQGFIVVFGIFSFYIYLCWKAESGLNLKWLFEYQKIFMSLGFAMLPLPTEVHPWMSILGIYLLMLLVAINAWNRGKTGVRVNMYFYLSILGLGLFVYYQGRSHILNLVTVCWPAVFVVAIGTDEMLRAVRARLLPISQLWLPLAGCTFLLIGAISFLQHVPMMWNDAKREFLTRGRPLEPVVQSELDFIRQASANYTGCYLLTRRQGLYLAEVGLQPTLKGPGRVEILLKADQDRLRDQLIDGAVPCIFLGAGQVSEAELGIVEEDLKIRYETINHNDLKTMSLLVRRGS
jgi:hypothetical protein